MKPALTPASPPLRANRLAGLFAPATVVLFAGCGGTCIGIEQAYVDGGYRDKYVDLAINHWDTAVGVHELNHPMTQHLRGDIREIDPDSVLLGRKIAYLHASPDCTHFSKARGSKPKKKEIRGLAWVVVDWAKARRPDVITLENVEEFRQWGPLAADGQPCPRRRGETFAQWKSALEALGYVVEHRELRACDYGAPTTRKRLFVVARCDGQPIVWPEKTHGSEEHLRRMQEGSPDDRRQGRALEQTERLVRAQRRGRDSDSLLEGVHRSSSGRDRQEPGHRADLKPFRTAAECINWSIPMLSIFASPAEASAWSAAVNVGRSKHDRVGVPRRPLKEKTLQRIARGLVKWVIEAKRPYIVRLAHGDQSKGGPRWGHSTHSVDEPLGTVAASKDFAAVDVAIAPYTAEIGNTGGNGGYTKPINAPTGTQTSKSKDLLVAATLQTLNHGGPEHRGQTPAEPLATITGANDARALVAALITKHYGDSGQRPASGMDEPLATVTAADHNALTVAHLMKFRGDSAGTPADEPCPTITGGGATARDAGAAHAMGVSVAYLSHQYTSNSCGGQGDPEKPLKTITSGGHHAAVTVALREAINGDAHDSRDGLHRSDSTLVGLSDCGRRGNDSNGGVEQVDPETVNPRLFRNEQGRSGDVLPSEPNIEDHTPHAASSVNDPRPTVAPYSIGAGGPAYSAKPRSIDEPLGTVMVDDRRAIVAAFLDTYYGNSKAGCDVGESAPTVVSKDRISLVTVVIDGQSYVVTDIAMRMLTPGELLLAQGFPPGYRVDVTAGGTPVSKADQVKLIGNAVPPPFARALAYANVVEMGVLNERKAVRS